jgi:hypothetical protein
VPKPELAPEAVGSSPRRVVLHSSRHGGQESSGCARYQSTTGFGASRSTVHVGGRVSRQGTPGRRLALDSIEGSGRAAFLVDAPSSLPNESASLDIEQHRCGCSSLAPTECKKWVETSGERSRAARVRSGLLLPVDHPLAAQQRSPRGDQAQSRRDVEHRVQAIHEGDRDEVREERLAQQDSLVRG